MENITLANCDFSKLLPLWMREDDTDKSLTESINAVAKDFASRAAGLSKWTDIDNMTEEQLDQMAWELNVSWYQHNANIHKKRDIIKNAKKIHRKLGTKWAMEQVLTIYFEESKVLEWYQYDGTPGHFKIQTYNTATVDSDAERFLAILDDVKRYSQILDDIEVLSSSSMKIDYIIRPRNVNKVWTKMKE